ncbi:MAG: glycoside hydrolase family 38 C-terminal domain-containing protein [Gemmatimonadota bacterium]
MPPLTFHLIPHTHWDREWYLPLGALRTRLVPVLDDLVDALESDLSLRTFLLDGQTVLVEDYLGIRPDRRAAFARLVKAGRIQVGPWYVLADEFIPSGEALIRNLLIGRTDSEALGGRMDVLYSPDAFGHPAAWPTLALEFGIRHGALWRGLGGANGQTGDLYEWQGAGGTILVYHLPPDGYEIGAALPADPARLPAAWHSVRAKVAGRASGHDVVVFVGADHHALHPSLGRLRDLLATIEPESEFRISSLEEAMVAMAGSARSLPRLQGEQRWSYGYTWTLQGVHGTRTPLKRRNSLLELALERGAEPLAALAGLIGKDRRPLLQDTWRTLVQCHFHDAIGGCCSDEVALAVEERQREVSAATSEMIRGALHELVGHDPDKAREQPEGTVPTLHLWNPAPRGRGGVQIAEVTFFRSDVFVGPTGGRKPRRSAPPAGFALEDGAGRTIPVQVLARAQALERLDAARHYPDQDEVEKVRIAFEAPETGGFNFTRLTITPSRRKATGQHGVTARGRRLENSFLAITVEPAGTVALHDKITGERFTGLLRLESGADLGDTYSYCPPPRDRVHWNRRAARVRVLSAGPLVGALQFEYELRAERGVDRAIGRITLRGTLELRADSPTVRCNFSIDNQAQDHRLRFRLPLGLAGVEALAGTQFGQVRRPPVVCDPADFPRETPVVTAPAHRFVTAAVESRGLALLAPGFFEYEWTSGGDLLFTILRAVGELSKPDLPTRPGHAGWPTPTPLAQCLGVTTFSLGLCTVNGAALASGHGLPGIWEDAFTPIESFWLRNFCETGRPPTLGVSLEGRGLVFSALKPADEESGMILRCYNPTDSAVEGAWRFHTSIRIAERMRADERSAMPVGVRRNGREVPFVARAGEIVTIRIG